jgi:hypothetical protein
MSLKEVRQVRSEIKALKLELESLKLAKESAILEYSNARTLLKNKMEEFKQMKDE